MAAQTYLDHLTEVPLFAGCTKRELQRIASAVDEVDVPDGKVLVEEGTPGRQAFVIVEGFAEVSRKGKKIATLGPGACFGELALLDRGPRTASVQAAGPLRVLVLSSREFISLLDEAPRLSRRLLENLARRVRELDDRAYA